jgi:hypothetical protein
VAKSKRTAVEHDILIETAPALQETRQKSNNPQLNGAGQFYSSLEGTAREILTNTLLDRVNNAMESTTDQRNSGSRNHSTEVATQRSIERASSEPLTVNPANLLRKADINCDIANMDGNGIIGSASDARRQRKRGPRGRFVKGIGR